MEIKKLDANSVEVSKTRRFTMDREHIQTQIDYWQSLMDLLK